MHALVFCLATLLSASSVTSYGCLPGTIKVAAKNDGGFICEPCANGTYSDKPDLTQCEACRNEHVCDPSCVENNTCDAYLLCVSVCQADHDTVVECRQPNFYYQTDHNTCWPCTKCEDFGEFTAQNCTGDTNTECCPVGTYYNRSGSDVCTECKHCEDIGQFTTLNCSGGNDTVCCAEEYMMFEDGQCVAYCSVKEFLVLHTESSNNNSSSSHDVCMTCAVNTTNYETRHRKQYCEEKCYENEAQGDRDKTICLEGEYKLGNSCYNYNRVVCAPSAADDKQSKNGGDFAVWKIVLIVTCVLVPIAAVIIFFHVKITRGWRPGFSFINSRSSSIWSI